MKRETEINKALRAWMAREGIKQPEAARRLGVPFGTLRNWVSGLRRPAAAAAAHVMAICGETTTKGE